MSEWRRTVFVVIGLLQVFGFIALMNTAGAELITTAESLPFVQNTWVWEPLQRIEFVAYTLIVPILILDLIIYKLIGSVQQERQERRYRV